MFGKSINIGELQRRLVEAADEAGKYNIGTGRRLFFLVYKSERMAIYIPEGVSTAVLKTALDKFRVTIKEGTITVK